MVNFQKRNKNEYALEEDRGSSSYRWVTLEKDRFGAGMVNCSDLDDAFELQRLVLELAPYMLSVSSLDVDSLDLAFAMDFDYKGNHDEVIAESFMSKTPFASFFENGYKPIDFSPSMVVALNSDMDLQGRVSIDSKTSVFEPGSEETSHEQAITASLAVRQYPPKNVKFNALASFAKQCRITQELMNEKIIPEFIKPLCETITQKRII